MERVCVFIDGSHFYFALKRNNFSTRVSYFELSKALAGPDRQLVRSFYFNSAYDPVLSPEQYASQKPFFSSLEKNPLLEIRLGKLLPEKGGGFTETGTDILLASELLYRAGKNDCDTLIVLTEDSDLGHPLTLVKELGKHLEIALFPDNQPRELMQSADRIIPLQEVLTKFKKIIFPTAPPPDETPDEINGNR